MLTQIGMIFPTMSAFCAIIMIFVFVCECECAWWRMGILAVDHCTRLYSQIRSHSWLKRNDQVNCVMIIMAEDVMAW